MKILFHEFSLLLRERRPVSLLNMQDAALEVESNILTSNRLKKEIAQQIYDRKGKKEAAPGVSTSHSVEGKIDEMAKLVKILTAKLNKLELEKNSNKPVQEGDRNLIIQTNSKDNLHLVSFPEREETMIYNEKQEKLRIKKCNHNSKIM